jgi:predicted dehydrogenase
MIGTGDEGGVLIGEHNPEFLEIAAVCDIRPTNLRRAFDGEPTGLRKGLKKVYGGNWVDIKQFNDYFQFMTYLKEHKDIQALVIALPLHLHAKVAIEAMKIGYDRGEPIHILTEKLMGWNIQQCKAMIRTARKTGSILSVGHQRHYSMLYAHAAEALQYGILGDIKHIRALWHRNNSWPYAAESVPVAYDKSIHQSTPMFRDGWFNPIAKEDFDALKDTLGNLKDEQGNRFFDDIEQLVRWRLYNQTGGGLMAELGSHQLDACSIFLGKVHPIAVSGVGVHSFYDYAEPGKKDEWGPRNPRDVEDHVFTTYEFPGKNYYERDSKGQIVEKDGKRLVKDRHDVVVVTYSSISTNGFEPYGECIMGSRGTMIVEMEQKLMLFGEQQPGKRGKPKEMAVAATTAGKDKAALEASSTWGGPASGPSAGSGPAGTAGGTISRGYKEEMEDFAVCIGAWDAKKAREEYERDGGKGKTEQRQTRCHGEIAMADAIVALTAIRTFHAGDNGADRRIVFKDEWFDANNDDVPDDKSKQPKVPV